tara:strand:+ start:262 stop:1581 length:1320 start_codon:yes stop_codon:yes gene_type:complete
MKISIHGSGYVGLVTGSCLADLGHEVICFDTDREKINKLKSGVAPIYEPGLEILIQDNLQKGNMVFTDDLELAVDKSDVHFIAVGTPSDEDGSADLASVLEVARSIATLMKDYKLIVTKSTVPVGSGSLLKQTIRETLVKEKKDISFDLASNPEFLKEGSAIKDFMKPDRIVLGVDNRKSESILKEIYNPFVKRSYRIISTSIESAELSKYAANAMLATRISFMNELSRLAEKVNADIEEVREIIGKDNRIGDSFLYPGLGFGGSCFPKDLRALNKIGMDNAVEMSILQSVLEANENQGNFFFEKIKGKFNGKLKNKKFAVWGLSFKPETDDIRESPGLILIHKILKEGAYVKAFDPAVTKESLKLGDNFRLTNNQYEAVEDCEALILATEWKSFWQPDFEKISNLLKRKLIFDGRNIYDGGSLIDKGFEYECIGRSIY